jgi:uncharacterized protein YfaS (alpha-2-macroglobulin family)
MSMRGAMAICWLAILLFGRTVDADEASRTRASQLQRDGNRAEAYELYQKLALGEEIDPFQISCQLGQGVECLDRLNRTKEVDDFIEAVVARHPDNWQVLHKAAQLFLQHHPHYGVIVAGKFERGSNHSGNMQTVHSYERDRVRALQLMDKALVAVNKAQAKPEEKATVHLAYAEFLLYDLYEIGSWRLQALTDLSQLPDYDKGSRYWNYRGGGTLGAPVNPDGSPVFHRLPESYATAQSDGERWRWLLAQAMENDPKLQPDIQLKLADFWRSQFGVQTMASYRGGFADYEEGDESSPYAVQYLNDDETIAKLATGIKRFLLPEEFNYLKIYRQVANGQNRCSTQALSRLADCYEDRRQYPKAAEAWRENIARFNDDKLETKAKRLLQIVGNWGQFEPSRTAAAGHEATVNFRFRNANKAVFTAREIKIQELLDDIKTHLKSNPPIINWQQMRIDDIGMMMLENSELSDKYLGDKVAEWSENLTPRPNHFDQVAAVKTPLIEPGAYFVEATLTDGNTSRIVVWLADTVIVRKPLQEGMLYFLADAETGAPVADAKLDFFGFRFDWHFKTWVDSGGRQRDVKTDEMTVMSNADGLCVLGQETLPKNDKNTWLITATTDSGRFAYLGFASQWLHRYKESGCEPVKVYLITDCPVYRPGDTVKFKFWVREAKYDQEDGSRFANTAFQIVLYCRKGRLLDQMCTTDAFGGGGGEYVLPKDAALGEYSLSVNAKPIYSRGTFRVEEYKKPEFEVTVDAPTEPVQLGDVITATIRAKYYFGAPVTDGRVRYTVRRTMRNSDWYPIRPWNWLYGPGYWWFAQNYDWYAGWGRWGCWAPSLQWASRSDPPDLIAENEVPLGPDGTVTVNFDTDVAKALHGRQDHRYEITAEVVDLSRRTIVGRGSVIAAREPFRVYGWVDRGYYHPNDTVTASFSARTVDGKPVVGKGELRLFAVRYGKDGLPVETEVERWALDTNAEGQARQLLTAAKAGQYRLGYTVTDAKGRTVEGGYLFNVTGEGLAKGNFHFNTLEVINDKAEYAPGDTANLMINTNHTNATVLFFARPTNNSYLVPKLLRIKGKSMLEPIAITQNDMPNVFVEAITVTGGRVHTVVRELVVPPEQRVLNIEVLPAAEKYKPGETARVRLKISDVHGRPVTSSVVVSVYDKAVEYISGGGNVPEIRAFFWKWRRHHRPQTESSIERNFYTLLHRDEINNKIMMRYLGVFGRYTENIERTIGQTAIEQSTRFSNTSQQIIASMRNDKGERGVMAYSGERMSPQGAAGDGQTANANNKMASGEPDHGEFVVRKNFADTAFWSTTLTPDNRGEMEIEVPMPESLTTWKIRAWAMAHGTKVGQGEAEVVTAKDFLIRLQAPRFLVEKDEAVLSAIVHNYHAAAKSARVTLELDGGTAKILDAAERQVDVPSGGEVRVDWRVRAEAEGELTVRMKALTVGDGDAMALTFPVRVHGMEKTVSWSGVIRPHGESANFAFSVPAERRPEQSVLEVRYSPTLAGAMVDALPYLVSYPYGCTEQTLNRFLPTIITQKVLRDMGVDLRDVRDKRANLNAQEIGDDQERARQWRKRAIVIGYDAKGKPVFTDNPVFDEKVVDDMVREGLRQLATMQLSDGSWGWFYGYGEYPYPHTTAVIVHGLQAAQACGVAVDANVLARGLKWLENYQNGQVKNLKRYHAERADDLDALVYRVLADGGKANPAMRDFLYRDRNGLSLYGKALLGIALLREKENDKLDMVVRNLEQFLEEDAENQTAWLRLDNGSYWWRWQGNEIETLATYLQLLVAREPKGPKAAGLVKYLLNNRKHATYWDSTRDTALCVEAFADYLRATGEMKPDMEIDVRLDGKTLKTVAITPENLFSFDNRLLLAGADLATGDHVMELVRRGQGPVYANAYFTYFSLEDPIRKAGLEIKVERNYFRLKRVEKTAAVAGDRGQVVDQRVEKFEREPLADLALLKSGDLVEVELTLESKNDYEYLVFEDFKAAGLEPVEVRSGYNGNDLGAYVEFRDEKVCFFVRQLARGRHSLSYRLRAEIPGRFSALPARAWAMYAPELRANADEIKLRIED